MTNNLKSGYKGLESGANDAVKNEEQLKISEQKNKKLSLTLVCGMNSATGARYVCLFSMFGHHCLSLKEGDALLQFSRL